MKRLKFKIPINGFGNAIQLIPEHYKVNGTEFQMTDGKETYQIKWDNNKAIIESAKYLVETKNKQKIVKEDVTRLKELFNYNPNIDNNTIINESELFLKTLKTEDVGTAIHNYLNPPVQQSDEDESDDDTFNSTQGDITKDELKTEGIDSQNTVSNFMFFIANYPPDFIINVWGDSIIGNHLLNKFEDLTSKYSSIESFVRFFFNLDNENRDMLISWVGENYHG